MVIFKQQNNREDEMGQGTGVEASRAGKKKINSSSSFGRALPQLSAGSQWHTVHGIFKGRVRGEGLSPAYRYQTA